MHRRLFLASLAAAAALPAAAAETSPAPSAATPTPGALPTTAAPAPAEVMGLGDAEKQHVAQTMAIGTLSLEMSKIALMKAQHPKVKEFANLEVAEQETVGDVLKAINAAANNMSPPPQLTPDETAMLEKMRQEQTGFDRSYIQGQIEGHQKLLKIQEDYLAVGKHLDSTNVAKLARGMIKEHLTLLSDLTRGPA
jgi:putative membrane protein